MLKIRLQRVGKKNFPSFRVVLTEHDKPVKGKFLEVLGFFNPLSKEKGFKVDRIKHWLSKGVKLSPTVHNLLVSDKIIDDKKVKAWTPKKKEVKEGEDKKESKAEADSGEVKEEVKEEKPKAEEVVDESKVKETPKEEAKATPKEKVKEEREEVKEEVNVEKESEAVDNK